jgi:hypothetical protein
MRKVIALVWVAIPPLLLSALIHSADSDVGGIRGLASPSTLLSVVALGSLVVAFAFVCLGLAIRFRWFSWVSVSVLVSAVVALILTFAQSPRPAGLAAIARPLLGGTLLVWLFLVVAVLPACALGWPRGGSRGEQAA